MKVHLIDGTYELFRHFFAVPSHINSDGQEIAATRGAVGSLLLLVEEGATHIAIATDEVITSFRNELYAPTKQVKELTPRCCLNFCCSRKWLRLRALWSGRWWSLKLMMP